MAILPNLKTLSLLNLTDFTVDTAAALARLPNLTLLELNSLKTIDAHTAKELVKIKDVDLDSLDSASKEIWRNAKQEKLTSPLEAPPPPVESSEPTTFSSPEITQNGITFKPETVTSVTVLPEVLQNLPTKLFNKDGNIKEEYRNSSEFKTGLSTVIFGKAYSKYIRTEIQKVQNKIIITAYNGLGRGVDVPIGRLEYDSNSSS